VGKKKLASDPKRMRADSKAHAMPNHKRMVQTTTMRKRITAAERQKL
jgi:hypothetical protein